LADLSGFKFTKTHEWVRPANGDEAFVGISDHAQGQLGDVIFLELPQVGARLESGARLGAVESVKAASDLYSPVAGEVLEVNSAVNESPELVNQDPYERGWLVKLRLDGPLPGTLMDEGAYQTYAEADQH